MKKKILIISESLTGGIRRHLLDYLLYERKHDFEFHLAYGKERADQVFRAKIKDLEKQGVRTYEIIDLQREIKLGKDLKAYGQIKKLIREIRPEIVHCHSSKAGGVGRIAAKLSGVKEIIYTPHAYILLDPTLSNRKRLIYKWIERLLARWSTTKTICVSHGERDLAITDGIVRDYNSLVIHNGIEIQDERIEDYRGKLRALVGAKEDEILVGAAMRLYKPKDPGTYYEIMRRVLKENENVKCVIIGDSVDGYKEDMQKRIKEDGLVNRFHLVDFREEASELICDLDIYLFTSLYEGLPYSLLEALRVGLPIVATDVTGNQDIIEDEGNGLLYKVGDVKRGVLHLTKLIEDKTLREEYGHNGLKRLKGLFTTNKMVEQIDKLYKGE